MFVQNCLLIHLILIRFLQCTTMGRKARTITTSSNPKALKWGSNVPLGLLVWGKVSSSPWWPGNFFSHYCFSIALYTVTFLKHVPRFGMLRTSWHSLFFKGKPLIAKSWKLPGFFSLCKEISVKTSRNGIDMFSFKIIKWE